MTTKPLKIDLGDGKLKQFNATDVVPPINLGSDSSEDKVLFGDSTFRVLPINYTHYVDYFSGQEIILPHLPVNSPMVIMNGQILSENDENFSRDYSIIGSTITLNSAVVYNNFQIRYKY